MKGFSGSKLIIIFVLLIITGTSLKFINGSSEKGVDSFQIHYLSEYISESSYISWIILPQSLFGWTYYSYPTGVPIILSMTSQITGLSSSIVIYLFSLIMYILGIVGIFLLSLSFFPSKKIATLSAILFGMSPLFLHFTNYNISTRGPLVVLHIYLFIYILKYLSTKKKNAFLMAIVILLTMSLVHRSFIISLFSVLFFITTHLGWNFCKRKNINIKYFRTYILLLILIILVIQLLPLKLITEQAWAYQSGYFFSTNIHTDNFWYSRFVLVTNLLIDYISNTGILSFLSILFLVIFVFKEDIPPRSFDLVFIIMSLSFFAINGYYTSFIMLPFILIMTTYTIHLLLSKIAGKSFRIPLYGALYLFSLGFSIFMLFHWTSELTDGEEEISISEGMLSTVNWANLNIDKSVLTSSKFISQRIRAYANFPVMPMNDRQDSALLQYGIISDKDIQPKWEIRNVLRPIGQYTLVPNRVVDSKDDWDYLIVHGLNGVFAYPIINRYQVGYAIERKYPQYYRKNWKLPMELESEQNKIYDNNYYSVWRLQP